MVIRSTNPWETISKAELVNIGTHKLFLSTSGISRKHGSPVVIFFTGGGAPIAPYIRLQRVLGEFTRVYFYDRAGYDTSERGPIDNPKAADSARECDTLMKTIKVAPPYILIAHSYGGIVMREFLNLHRPHTNNVVGMILADTASELMYQVFSAIPEPDLVAVSDGVDFAEITHLREESKLSDEEWDATIAAMERTTKKQNANREDSRGSGLPLARKKQFQTQALDSWPLSVIRSNMANDWRIMYEAGVKAGNGTEEQRHGARGFIERFELFGDDLMAAQLRLSSQNHYVYIADCGHDFPVRRPEIIREELRWILEHLSP